MQLTIENANEFGEGCKKLTINGLLISVFTPGSECEQNLNTIIKKRKKNYKVEIKPVTGEITMLFKNELGESREVLKIPKDVKSLHIDNLPINIFRFGSNVHKNMQLCFPNAKL